MKVKFQIALTLFLTLNLVSKCQAAPAKWPIADGGNDHSYLAIALENPISWADANEMANKLGGHLVTLTSAAENDFVFHLIDREMYWYPGINLRGPWTGGYQLPGSSEPTGGWSWVTGGLSSAWRRSLLPFGSGSNMSTASVFLSSVCC